MAASLRDWQLQGIDLKVELATSGELVVGGTQQDFPFNSGGTGGAPKGWTAAEYGSTPPTNTNLYNFTTASGVSSVSIKTAPTATPYKSAGFYSMTFPLVPGFKYQLAIEARKMDGKGNSERSVTLQRSNNGGSSWSYFIGSSGSAEADWESILVTSGSVLAAGYTLGRFEIMATCPMSEATLWGVQFRDLSIKQMDLQPLPLTWRDITCDVRSLAIRYGRERFTNRYDVSTMMVELLNTSGVYSFQEVHDFGLRPGRQVRVTATHNAVTYPIAFHVIDAINDAYSMDGLAITQFSCVDPTSILSKALVKTAAGSAMDIPTRVNKLLDQVGYQSRSIANTTTWNTQKIVSSGSTIRDEIGLTADSEGGHFFAGRSGEVIYRGRNWAPADTNIQQVTADLVAWEDYPVPLPTVDDTPNQAGIDLMELRSLVTDWSMDRVINTVSLANAGGTVHEYEDLVSIKAHGPQTYQRHDFILYTDSPLDTRAADMMTGYSDPVLRVTALSFAPGMKPAAWPWTLSVFLNWLVRVWYVNTVHSWGYTVCVHIQSIEQRITPTDWEVSMSVDLPTDFRTFTYSQRGWDVAEWDTDVWDG